MQSITDLHEEVFQYLMEKRKTMPDLYFNFRGREDEKLLKGYWFDGSEKSVRFSFWKGFDVVSKTQRISLTITLEGELQLYLVSRDSKDYAKVFELITKTLGNSFTQYNNKGKIENHWLKRYEGDNWRKNLDSFILQEMPLIDGMLGISLGNIKDTQTIERLNYIFHENLVQNARNHHFRAIEAQEKYKLQAMEEAERKRQEEERRRAEEERKRVKKLFLRSITLENIGHFEKIELNSLSDRVTILIGENGSGKSTILRAIALAITGINAFQPEGEDFNKFALKNEDLTKWLRILDTEGNEPTYAQKAQIKLNYFFDDKVFENQVILRKDERDKFADVTEEGDFQTFTERQTQKGSQKHLSNLVIALPQGSGYKAPEKFEESLFPDPFQMLNIIKDSAVDRLSNLANWIELYDFRYKEKEPKERHWLLAIEHLFEIISEITFEEGKDDSRVEFLKVSKNNDNKTRIVIKKTDNPKGIYLDLLSQGYNNLFYWIGSILSSLYRFKDYCQNEPDYEKYAELPIKEIPAIVLIDEIDTYLHPNWQANILRVLVDEFPNIQFVVTTHSDLVLSSLENATIYFVGKNQVEELFDTYGLDSNSILRDKMNSYIRSPKVQEKLNQIFEYIEKGELDRAEEKLSFFDDKPQMSDVLQAKFRLRQKRKAHEAHQ